MLNFLHEFTKNKINTLKSKQVYFGKFTSPGVLED